MKELCKILKVIGLVVGFFATYVFLVTDALEVNMWGLAWPYWAMIGFTIFWVSFAIILWQLYSENKKLKSPEHLLEQKKKQLEVEELERKTADQDSIQILEGIQSTETKG